MQTRPPRSVRQRRPSPVQRQSGQRLESTTRAYLEPRFGHSLADIRIFHNPQADRLSKENDAAAFTVGQDIFFAQGNYEPETPMGQRLIAHEVAHAVQQRGVAAPDDLSSLPTAAKGSRSETEAHAAAETVLSGGSASVTPATAPAISRWESGEHKKAVDEAIKNLPPDQQVDPEVAKQMTAKIKLANGLEVTPGEITAMMGDLYGRFDKKTGDFDPKASFDQMTHADPKEMSALIKLIDDEAKTGKPANARDFERATRHRSDGDDSYLELAKKNNSHFSAPDAKGTNSNMGAYSAFHQMALEAAAKGDMETARALEASSGHYLTDRFSAGHNFEKNGVMAASGHEANGVLANMAVKTAHDDFNNNGTMVADGKGDPAWKAYGDGNWDRDENAQNRQHTASAVYGSWSELEKVSDHKVSVADIDKQGFDALKSVPQFDPKNQERAEAVARNTSLPGMLMQYGGSIPDAAIGNYFWRPEGHVENALSDAWDWTKDTAGAAWDGTKHVAGEAWDATKGAAHHAWDWTKHAASTGAHAVGDAASWAGHEISAGAHAVEHGASRAWHWATDWL